MPNSESKDDRMIAVLELALEQLKLWEVAADGLHMGGLGRSLRELERANVLMPATIAVREALKELKAEKAARE